MASAAQERRNAAARAEGYESYYDKRVREGGPPGGPRPTGEDLARARGHRGEADLAQVIASGRVVLTIVNPVAHNSQGQWTVIEVTVTLGPDRFGRGTGREITFRLRQRHLNYNTIGPLVDALGSGGSGAVVDRYNVFGWALEQAADIDDYDNDYDDLDLAA